MMESTAPGSSQSSQAKCTYTYAYFLMECIIPGEYYNHLA